MANEKPVEKKIKCRVVAVNYGLYNKGDEVEVTERELRRVGGHVLISLDDEKRRLAEEQQSGAPDRRIVEADRARRQAIRQQEETRLRMEREHRLGRATDAQAVASRAAGK
jgi:hypothetical protein